MGWSFRHGQPICRPGMNQIGFALNKPYDNSTEAGNITRSRE